MTTILLAAGLSSRMGKNKLLLEYNGKTIIENTLMSVLPLSDKVIVVTGFEKERMEEALRPYPVTFVYNDKFLNGQKESTLCGLREVDNDDFAILPGDLPLLSSANVESLFSALESSLIVRPLYKNIPGHPVCYKKENREKLLAFPGSMKDYLKNIGFKTISSEIGTIYDTDNPLRYEALLLCNSNLSILDGYID